MATISQSEFERQIVASGHVSSRKSAEAVSKFIKSGLRNQSDDAFVALLPGLRQLGAVRDDTTARRILLAAQKWLGFTDGSTNHLGYKRFTNLPARLGLDVQQKSATAKAVAAVAVAGLRLHLSALSVQVGQFAGLVADLAGGPVVDPASFIKGQTIPAHLLRSSLDVTKGLGGDGAIFLAGGDCGTTGVI